MWRCAEGPTAGVELCHGLGVRHLDLGIGLEEVELRHPVGPFEHEAAGAKAPGQHPQAPAHHFPAGGQHHVPLAARVVRPALTPAT